MASTPGRGGPHATAHSPATNASPTISPTISRATPRTASRTTPRSRTTPVIVGVSLKLYLDIAASTRWASALAEIARHHPEITRGAVKIFALPSLPAIPSVREALTGVPVAFGAQDLHWDDRGAFTGGISGADLREWGCSLVEVAHAERRSVFGEDERVARAKLAAAVRNGLTPVLCIGEREQLPADAAAEQCVAQLDFLLGGLDAPAGDLIVGYEPVWAIGKPTPASADHVRAVVAALRARLALQPEFDSTAIIYGGSAQPGTLTELGDAVDGVFLGRFAHDPASLAHIIDEAGRLVVEG